MSENNKAGFERAKRTRSLLRQINRLIVKAQSYVGLDQNVPLEAVRKAFRLVVLAEERRCAKLWGETNEKREFDRQTQDGVKALEGEEGKP